MQWGKSRIMIYGGGKQFHELLPGFIMWNYVPRTPTRCPTIPENVDELLAWNSFNDLKLGPLKLAW